MNHFKMSDNVPESMIYTLHGIDICSLAKLTFFLCSTSILPARAQDISFKDAFNAAAKQDVLTISLAQDDTLIFETGEYYTSGRNILISAQKARLTGVTKLGFYPPTDQPNPVPGVAKEGKTGNTGGESSNGTNGEAGGIGAPGNNGLPGAAMFIKLGTLIGDGTLALINTGQMGGKGQQGGRGGSGGRGGDGLDRSCGGLAGLDTRRGPGDGGNGGRGGDGGQGGSGGQGGEGGTIIVSASLAVAFQSGLIRFDITPANGGPGGEGGDAGSMGKFGSMGGGGSCGGGGNNGRNGTPGNHGMIGEEGRKGSTGAIRYVRQDGTLVSAYTCRLSDIMSCPSLE